MKTRIQAFDFTRVLCTFGIIIFHFSVTTASKFKPLVFFPNGAWGDIFVGIFFILSGGLLFVNNRDTSLAAFYYKRWKSIYPPFYIAYIICFILSLPKNGSGLIRPFSHYIPSILGMDGVINTFELFDIFPNVYMIGEWFLGAIIICYLFMPAVIAISRKADLPLLAALFVVAYIINIKYVSNVAAWLFYMQAGIVLMSRKIWKNGFVFLFSLVGCFFLGSVKFKVIKYVPAREMLLAVMLFIVMSYLGQYIMMDRFLAKRILKLSTWSFCIFLLHHFILDNVLLFMNSPNPAIAFAELLFITAAAVAAGFLLHKVTSALLGSRPYKSFEKIFIRPRKRRPKSLPADLS